MAFQGWVALAYSSHIKSINMYIDQIKITEEGCKFISEGKWPELEHLSLDLKIINEEGCKYLSQGKWPKLKLLSLGT